MEKNVKLDTFHCGDIFPELDLQLGKLPLSPVLFIQFCFRGHFLKGYKIPLWNLITK